MAPCSVTLIALCFVAYTHATERCEEGDASCDNNEKDVLSLLQAFSAIEHIQKQEAHLNTDASKMEKKSADLNTDTKKIDKDDTCSAHVAGSVEVEASWLWGQGSHCKCPGNTVIDGDTPFCQAKAAVFEQNFNFNSILAKQGCECRFKAGCGMIEFSDMDDLLPANPSTNLNQKGMPTPILISNPSNTDTGVKELDEICYGVWWMKDNPVPEELVSFAESYSRLSGQNVAASDVDWPLTFYTPNAKAYRWTWPWTTTAKHIIMPQYTSAASGNNFTMESTTDGYIETGLTDFPLVWVEAFGFHKISEHEWNRPTTFQSGSPWPNTNYTLTRIIDKDGNPVQPYFNQFKDYFANRGDTMVAWDSDDSCKRSCMLGGDSCSDCHKKCVPSVAEGSLTVTVTKAENLHASADYCVWWGCEPDAFVTIKVGKHEKSTSHIDDVVNPTWDFTTNLGLRPQDYLVTLDVYDFDFANANDHIGSVTVNFRDLEKGVEHSLTRDLDQGQLHFKLEWTQ